MDEEFFVFVPAHPAQHCSVTLHNKDKAEAFINKPDINHARWVLCRVVPVSVEERSVVVTETRKVIV